MLVRGAEKLFVDTNVFAHVIVAYWFFTLSTHQCCAGCSDGVAERRLAHGSGSRWKAKSLSHEGVFGGKKPSKKEPRAKYCIKWLLMLYYECGRLNGLWSPFGIETWPRDQESPLVNSAKWPVE